jgi:hypothetical protein
MEVLQESMEKWDTPALRYVFLAYFTTPLTDVIDHFLGRFAHQIESLDLTNFIEPVSDHPSDFWAQFTALRLLGLDDWALKREEWPGWSIVPPPIHPCRYPVCHLDSSEKSKINHVRSRWTWHDGVKLVA